MRHEAGWETFLSMFSSEYQGCKKNLFVHHGDAVEAITVDDKRYDIRTTKNPIPLEQAYQCVENLKPLSKIDPRGVLLMGNHEAALLKFGNISEFIADSLNLQFGTYSCKIHYVDKKGRLLFKHFATHGRRSISSAADDPERRLTNRRLSLKRLLKNKAGDCALMSRGHTHQLLTLSPSPSLYLTDNGRELQQHYTTDHADITGRWIHPDSRWYVSTGCFYRLYGDMGQVSYAEMFDYDPTELGFAVVRVRNRVIAGIDQIVV